MNYIENKKILLGITGSVAIYKACELIRALKKHHAQVEVIMTPAAQRLIQPSLFEALTSHPVYSDLFDQAQHIDHIQLTRSADALILYPATANIIAKTAHGICDDLLSTLIMARGDCTMFVAPAMNQAMWNNSCTQRNIKQIQEDGVHLIKPDYGLQACSEVGMGRLAQVDEVIETLQVHFAPKPLLGLHILLTAGRTQEKIDPVRVITNLSSGKMGFSIAKEARRLGANVTLVHGLADLNPPKNIQCIQAPTAQSMHQAVMNHINNKDIFISVAAVSDWRVLNPSKEKIKKQAHTTPHIEWGENPDILYEVCHLKNKPLCVGFAAETQDVERSALAKKERKACHIMIANKAQNTLGSENISFTAYTEYQKPQSFDDIPKSTAAHQILNIIAKTYHLHQENTHV